MKVLVTHWHPQTLRPSIGSANRTIWYDLKTWPGIVRRCAKLWPGQRIHAEQMNPMNIYAKSIEEREFTAFCTDVRCNCET